MLILTHNSEDLTMLSLLAYLYVRNPKTLRTNQFSGTELQVLGSMITEGCNELRDWVDSRNY